MPRIRMTKLSCSPAGVRQVGSEHDVTTEEARALLSDNAAVLVGIETTTKTAPENAATRTGKPHKTDVGKPTKPDAGK